MLKPLNNDRGITLPTLVMFMVVLFMIAGIGAVAKSNYANAKPILAQAAQNLSYYNDAESKALNSQFKLIDQPLSGTITTSKGNIGWTLEPQANIQTADQVHVYNFDTTGYTLNNVSVSGNENFQSFLYSENKINGNSSRYLISADTSSQSVLYDGTGTNIVLETAPEFSKVAYRVNGGDLTYKSDYPSDTLLPITQGQGSIVNIYYYNATGELIKSVRTVFGASASIDTQQNYARIVDLPSKDVFVDSDILSTLNRYNSLSLSTSSEYSETLGRDLLSSEVDLSFVTNMTNLVEVKVGVDPFDPSNPTQYAYTYKEDGGQSFTQADIISSNELVLSHEVTKNTGLFDLDSVFLLNPISKLNTPITDERSATLKITNGIVRDITITKKKVVAAEYRLRVHNQLGETVRDKSVLVTK